MVTDTLKKLKSLNWKKTTANEVSLKISKGTTPPKNNSDTKNPIPFLRVNNLTFTGKVNYNSEIIFIEKSIHDSILARSKAYPNDVLMNIVGPPLGKIVLLDNSYPEYNMNQAIVFFHLNNKLIDAKFFLTYLYSHKIQYWLQSQSKKTSGQQNLTIEICKNIPILLPPLAEQEKIAEILSTWDQAIESTEKLIANAELQKKALMQQLLTGKKRLLDENGERFSGKWEKVKLGSLIQEIKKEKVQNPNEIELLTVRLHHKGVIPSGKFPQATAKGRPYYKRSKGELIIGRQNLHNGGIAIVNEECHNLIASNAISSFKNTSLADIQFLLCLMSTNQFKFTIDTLTGGTGQKEISTIELKKIMIKVPEIQEQQKIAEVLSTADREIELLTEKLEYLKAEKKALMQQLLTGKRRVKVA